MQTGLMLVGSLISAAGSIMQAQAQAAAIRANAEAQARAQERQAERERRAANRALAEGDRQRRQAENDQLEMEGAFIARAAGSGFSTQSPDFYVRNENNAAEWRREQNRLGYNARLRAHGFRTAAAENEAGAVNTRRVGAANASAARRSGYFSAATTALSAGARLYESRALPRASAQLAVNI